MTTQNPDYPIRYDLDPARVMTDSDDWTRKGRPRCHGMRLYGEGRCQSFSGYNGFCSAHDPNGSLARTRKENPQRFSRGGNKLMRLMPPRLRPVFEQLVVAMQDVYSGAITPSQATALAALATASVRVLQSGELE